MSSSSSTAVEPGTSASVARQTQAVRWRWLLLPLAVAIYVFPGLIGHDPWKQDETYVTSIIAHLERTHDWIVPRSAGLPFLEKPPLYFAVAEASADLFEGRLALHDAARLANALWMAITFGSVALAARRSWPDRAYAPSAAVLTLIACLGLVLQAHLLVVDVALLAGFAVALLGLALLLERPAAGGALLGTGAGVGFLAKGLLAPGCVGLTALLLPALFRAWRTRAYGRAVGFATLACLPWLVVWPVALYLRAPELFDQWFWQQNLGRFFGYASLGASPESWYYAKTLPWFAFPALPLAAWALWRRRSGWRDDRPLQSCAVMTAVIIATLSLAGSMRALYLLPALLPMSLLAAAEAETLPAKVQRHLGAIACAIFGVAALALWGMCLAIAVSGSPPDWLGLGEWLPLNDAPRAQPIAVALAAAATVAWLATLRRLVRSRIAAVAGCALGLMLVWLLLATLWMPWINAAKSYRAMFDDMRLHLPQRFDCVNSLRLGESEAAMLDYEGGIVAVPLEKIPGSRCSLVWVQDNQSDPSEAPDPSWTLLWSGHRPGDSKERHRLFARRF
ncbi:MAG TPA: glycosyltransferase family 39 protein [Casimicrobiaceae bacterium]|nr:glycosyltransferase family 39 protein [Casimicrobiaceae bacterium]